MKLSASKFNEKNVFRQFQKKNFSQMSAVRTGVRAYMDATPLQSFVTNVVEMAHDTQLGGKAVGIELQLI